jgi:hypothetical protein
MADLMGLQGNSTLIALFGAGMTGKKGMLQSAGFALRASSA